jgi:hypothetical protein
MSAISFLKYNKYFAGPGSVIWALSAELFDSNSRAVGLSINFFVSGISVFFLTKYFPAIMASVGSAATYWGFSVNCLLFCAYILICIPETKGKTFSEIQRSLGAKTSAEKKLPMETRKEISSYNK